MKSSIFRREEELLKNTKDILTKNNLSNENIELFTKVTDVAKLSKKQVAKISARLPEYHRAKSIIGHGTSQTSYSLQTMQMISDSPLSRMKQCLAQIDKKYNALREAYFSVEKLKLEARKLEKNRDHESRLRVREILTQTDSITINMQTTLRQIGMFQDMYDSIKKSNNIPDNWSEKDYEKQEISHMVKSSFRLAIQDLSANGRISHACVEYWEQLGIHPQVAEIRTRKYLTDTQMKINANDYVSIQEMYTFLDEMAEEFKDAHKEALERIGLNGVGSEQFMAEGGTKPT